jgi:ABC-2 type transport system ATP-binding protein
MRTWEYIRKVNEEGTTIFLTTHYMDEADRLSDRISIIDHGRIVVSGTGEELKNALGEDMIYLETEDNRLAREVLTGIDSVKDVKPALRGLSVTLSDDGTRCLPVILERLKEKGLGIRSVNLKKPTLDDVFVHFTGREIRG